MSSPELTNKMLDAVSIGLNPACTVHIHEGTVRSSKTVTAIIEWFEAVQQSDEELHLIAAADLDAIRENLTDVRFGLCEQFPEYCSIIKDKIGGYYLRVICDISGKPSVKRALLVGYSSADKWKKILGKTFGVVLIDEVNTANEQFVDECFARQVSVDNPLQVWTLNGDIPTSWVYTKYINRAKIIGDAPASIRADMDKVKNERGFYYQHWTMRDNPMMTEEKIARAMAIYPKGSYYYTVKILGERGVPGDLIYADYISAKLIKPLKLTDYQYYAVGVDIGATRAKNSYVLIGFKDDFSAAGVIDKSSFNSCGYIEKTTKLKAFCDYWQCQGISIDYIAVDSAEMNYIKDLEAEFRREGYPKVIPSYKATIKQRIDMMIILMSRGKVAFNDTEAARDVYKAFQAAKWTDGKKGDEREDKNEWLNDVMDSTEYAMTRHMKKLIKSVGGKSE